MSASQLERWHRDRARQALIGTAIAPWCGSRGDHLRRLNTGIALRTYLLIKGVQP